MLAVSMQSEAPLTLILSPLRAGRGEQERTFLGSLVGEPDTVPPKVSARSFPRSFLHRADELEERFRGRFLIIGHYVFPAIVVNNAQCELQAVGLAAWRG